MPCNCAAGKCTSCACAKAGAFCTHACHGGASNCHCLNFAEAVQAKKLGLPAIRKTLASNGLDVMGTKDELVRRLADQLVSVKAATGSGAGAAAASSSAGAGGGGGGGGACGAARLIQAIIDRSEAGSTNAALLSLSGIDVDANSSTTDMRKAYRKLSVKVHPDKNGNSAESKQAFQAVVSAYEQLSRPEAAEEEGGKTAKERKKPTRVVRGNGGCHKTKIACPRCSMEWGKAELGLEDAAYNFLMMGLKEYVCGRCACAFGCMTAQHRCPHCRGDFEYHPQDYHRKIRCGKASCTREFGFWQFSVAERRENEVRKEVKLLSEERMKRRESQARRAARMQKRNGGDAGGESGASKEEQLFVMGLLDSCPRCGGNPSATTTEAAQEHLRNCNDQAMIAKHTAAKAREKARHAASSRGQAAQDDAMALAQWELNGRQVGQLWMLSEHALLQQCEIYGVPLPPPEEQQLPKPKLIAILAKALRQLDKGRLLTDGSAAMNAAAAEVDTAGIEDVEHEELPSNLHQMEAEQLQAVCAGYGLEYDDSDGKRELIKIIEGARYKHEPQMLLGNGGADGKGKKVAMLADRSGDGGSGKKRGRPDDEDEEGEEGDDAYVPEKPKQPAPKKAKPSKNRQPEEAAASQPGGGGGGSGKAVRGIVKARTGASGTREYKVRFKDCGPEDDEWLTATHPTLAAEPKHIAKFERKLAERQAQREAEAAAAAGRRS